jgi:hypothetical protein
MHQVLTFKASYSQITNFTFRCSFPRILTLMLLAITASQAHAQGFGISKIRVQLSPKNPPAVYPVGTDFLVEISSRASINQNYLRRLQDGLEISLPRYDSRLNLVFDKPETVLSCVVLEMRASSRLAIANRTVYKKTGEHTVTDSTTGATQTIEDFAYVQESYDVTTLEGRASVRYEIIDIATGKVLEGNTVTADYRQSFELNPPHITVAYISLTDKIVQLIAARFIPTFNAPIVVNAPKGKLERASALLENGLWNSALAEVNRVPQFKKPEEEAYRLYVFGLAYEGLAYETADLASSKSFLEKAANYYDNASRKNYDEPDIQHAAFRLSRLLQNYKRHETSILAYENRRRQKDLKALEASKIQRHFGTSNVITNDTIRDWAKAGTPEKTIAKRIENAPAKYFDLSASGLAELTGAGVSPSVIDAMRRTMIPNQYNRKPRYKWVGTTVGYALVYFPYWFIH